MKKPRLVMIGNGMAGVRTLEELLKLAPDLYDITVFGGGIIPDDDIPALKEAGVSAIFGPGTTIGEVAALRIVAVDPNSLAAVQANEEVKKPA